MSQLNRWQFQDALIVTVSAIDTCLLVPRHCIAAVYHFCAGIPKALQIKHLLLKCFEHQKKLVALDCTSPFPTVFTKSVVALHVANCHLKEENNDCL